MGIDTNIANPYANSYDYILKLFKFTVSSRFFGGFIVVQNTTLRSIRAALTIIFLFIGTLILIQFDGFRVNHAVADSNLETNRDALEMSDNAEGSSVANCRYGIVAGQQYGWVVAETGAGIFYKFSNPEWAGPMPENDAEFIHMIRTKQKKTETGVYLPDWYTNVPLDENLANLISSNPGDMWIVGNEVERGPNPGDLNPKNLATDDIYAEIYVEAYHDVYNFIKSIDPTARVANAGLIQITPMRLQYLDKMWDAYQQKYGEPMPVDVWTIHAYVLPELDANGQANNIASVALGTNPALGKLASGGNSALCTNDNVYCIAEHDDITILDAQIVAMRQWMKARGQQQKPLVVTEYGTLYTYNNNGGNCTLKDEFGNCFTPERVSKFMGETFDYFKTTKDPNLGYALDDDKLVQQWIWFSAFSSNGNSGNLLKNTGEDYNLVGEAFIDYIQGETTFKNLFVEKASGIQISEDQGGTSTARLSVTFRNDGNVAVDGSFKVTFYSDAALTTPIGTTTVTPLVRGCTTRSYTAEVDWSGLPSGTHQFWVLVDSDNAVPEQPSGNADNIGMGQVTVKSTPYYTIDLQIVNLGIGSGGSVGRSPNLPSYEQGTEVTLTAIPFAGWTFSGWDGALTGLNPTAKLTMNSNVTVKAKFTQKLYDLDVKLAGEGTVLISPQKGKYVFGDKVTLTAQPKEGWRFATWSGDINDNTSPIKITFQDDISVTAHFVEMPPGYIFMPVVINKGK